MLKSLFRRPEPLDVAQALQQAVAYHQQGRLDEAERLYRAILAIQSDHFDARHLLGVIRLQQRRHEEAHTFIAEALLARPGSAEALSNAGLALQGLDRNDEAVASYDRAIAIRPDYADAFFNRGNALHVLGRHNEGLASYERAVELQPDHAVAWAHRAHTLAALGRREEAMASYERALALRPDQSEALNSLGSLLARRGRFDEAIARYDQALALRPDFADALNNRGNALHAVNRDEEAIADFDEALSVRPGFVNALYSRAIAYRARGWQDDAMADYEQALAVKPDHVDSLYNLGTLLHERGRLVEALAAHQKVIAIDPDFKYARGSVAFKRAQLCSWDGFDRIADSIIHDVRIGKAVCGPFELMTLSHDPAVQLACARTYARDACPVHANPLWTGERYAHDRIRIAYLSANFHEHAVAYLMAGLFERHDRARFDITGVSFGPPQEDAMRNRLVAAFERFIDVRSLTDEDVAKSLRAMEIDIAVDLMGHTKDARAGILAWRPAPVQVSYLGYPGTMGAELIDYIVADEFVIPPRSRCHYSEQVVYLPDTFQVNDAGRRAGERTPSRGELGLPDTGFVFCSFNSSFKLTPSFFDIWMRLLRQVEGSVLWILAGAADVERNLRREAEARGVAPERIVFAPTVAHEQYLSRYRVADLFLDSLPYNAGTTASDALWAGLPVLTCAGSAYAARMAGSLLTGLGLPELITYAVADYESRALELATQPSLLRELRERLARNTQTAPVFDTDRFRQHVETAYASMCESRRRGEKPTSFAVQSVAA